MPPKSRPIKQKPSSQASTNSEDTDDITALLANISAVAAKKQKEKKKNLEKEAQDVRANLNSRLASVLEGQNQNGETTFQSLYADVEAAEDDVARTIDELERLELEFDTFISGFSAEERNVLKTRHHEHKDALEQMGKILKAESSYVEAIVRPNALLAETSMVMHSAYTPTRKVTGGR